MTKRPKIIVCKKCKVRVNDYGVAHDSHFKCPKCHKTLFQDTGEGGLEIEEVDDVCFFCSNGEGEFICNDCRKMIKQIAKGLTIMINEDD